MQRLMLFDRFDQPLGELSEREVLGLVLNERINGEHTLTITTTRVLQQGWRVLTCDARGKWREHVVYGTDAAHDAGEMPYGDYFCVWSVQADLMGTRVSAMPGVQTPVAASVALTAALGGTDRWQSGTVTNTATGGASMYDTDGWGAMSVLVAEWGGEIDVTIEVGSSGVTARRVDLYALQGDQTAKRRYDFGADITSVRRKVADGPLYCRITPRGRGEESGDGYGRKITIESVNDGKDYLENAAMVALAKLPDGSGGWEYPTVEAENPDCETPAELKAWAQTVLDEYTVPKVTYEIDVVQLAREGVDMHGASLGDAIHVVDRKFGDGLRVEGRVLQVTTNLLDEDDVQLVVGSFAGDLAGLFGNLDARISQVTETVQAMNGGTMSTAEYLSRLLERINAETNALGGYTYITEGSGIRCYDTAVSDPTDGTAEASKVVEIKGGTIRIADSKTAQGEWDWKTVFVSGHILASLVTAVAITAGTIGSADSGNFWNLDTGEFRMATTATLGNRTVQQVLDGVSASITAVAVQYAQNQSATTAPITGWSTTAPSYQSGYYIWSRTATTTPGGTTYSTPVMISGRDGVDGQDGTSVTILGSYNSLADLQAAHPTGNLGDGYLIAGDLYVWNGTAWTDVGTIQGPQGDPGADGADGTNAYVHIAWATSADGSQGFSTTVSTGKTYLGSYTDNTAADSQSYSDYSWSLIKGADGTDGSDGADGVGITSIVEQYYLSTSNSTQTGGSWSTQQPAWSSGHYIWTRSEITWDTTPATVTTTTPVLAQAINGANEAVAALDADLDQAEIFARLTDNGALQGLYMSNGELYINASYILAGYLNASRIHGGTLSLGGSGNGNGILAVFDASGNQIGTFDKDGLVTTGAVSLRAPGRASGSTHYLELTTFTFSDYLGNSLTRPGLVLRSTGETLNSKLALASLGSSSYSSGDTYHESCIVGYGPMSIEANVAKSIKDVIYLGPQYIDIFCYNGGNTMYQTMKPRSISYIASSSNGTVFNYMTSTATATSSATNVTTKHAGTFKVTGTKSRQVETDDYDDRLLYSYETPAPMFGDIGSGTLDSTGYCYVSIDDVFAETARTDLTYQVFLQKCGQGDLWVESKEATHFVVRGTPGLAFDWEIKCRQRDYEHLRLENETLQEGVREEYNYGDGVLDALAGEDDFISLMEQIYDEELQAA